jgi:hypothetical protein
MISSFARPSLFDAPAAFAGAGPLARRATSTPLVVLTWLAGLAALGAVGCDGEGALSGAPTQVSDAGPLPTTQPGVDAGPPATPIGPRKRTVEARNPFGGPGGNLMADGDFELSYTYVGAQAPWRGFNSAGTGEVGFDFETGGLCRSGLRCAVLRDGMVLLGIGAAAPQQKRVLASAAAKVPAGAACDVVSVYLIDCGSFGVVAELAPRADAPGADGWCSYEDDVSGRDSSLCMYAQTSLDDGQTALLDATVLEPHDGTVPFAAKAAPTVSEATALRLARMRDHLRRKLPFGKAPEPSRPTVAP